MSKAEKFIIEHTSVLKDSNGKEYFKWITPDQAREAVHIANTELIDKTLEFMKDKLYRSDRSGYVGVMELCYEYQEEMKRQHLF